MPTKGDVTQTPSTSGAAGAAGAAGATGDMLTVLGILDGESAANINAALQTMTPDVSSGAMQGSRTLNSRFMNAVSNRLASFNLLADLD